MIGSILEWNGSNGVLLNIDEGDITYPFASGDVTGEISKGDVVYFSNNGEVGANSRAILITKKT